MYKKKSAFLSTRQRFGLLELAQLIVTCGHNLLCDQQTASFLGQGGLEVAVVEAYDAGECELVICDLLDCKQLINQEGGLSEEQIRSNMDVDHQLIILAAAKNYQRTAIVIDSGDHRTLIDSLRHLGEVTQTFRTYLAAKAFCKLAEHNFAISAYLNLKGANVGEQQKLPF